MLSTVIEWVVKILVIFGVLITAVAYLSYMERKVMGWMQLRKGPNRVGPFGLLQPAADGLKFLFKEDLIPAEANKLVFAIAPALILIPAVMTIIVIPYGSQLTFGHTTIALHVTSLDVGLLYLLGLGSLGVYGLALAGWSSNNKYSLIGALRSSAQMVSYELALGLSIVGVLIQAGSLDLVQIVHGQAGWHHLRWNVFLVQPVGFLIFYIAALAETNRIPFDLPEAETELIAGYHTEYSSMKMAMFLMAEEFNVITSSCVAVTLFFGGWMGPGVDSYPWLSLVYFFLKVFVVVFLFVWIRFTLPRLRYDQLMSFGWKVLLPAAILNVIFTATLVMFFPSLTH
ncbi:MAG: NADH-quinone oxidoreductase subunit NuoH [Blastocatellia bacterium]